MKRISGCVVFVLLTSILQLWGAMPVGEEAPTNRPVILVPAPVGSEAGGTQAAAAKPDRVRFRNLDLLHGQLVAVGSEGLRWSHPQAKSPLVFELGGLHEIQMGNPLAVPTGAVARVHLTNEDVLTGELVELTEESLKLQTWYAGSVTIKRAMLATIQPNTSLGSRLYAGPTSLEEWIPNKQRANIGWSFRKGALYSPPGGGRNLGRDVKLPEQASIECEVSWPNYPSFFMLFYVDNTDNYYQGEGYALQISGSTVYLQRSVRGSGMNNVEAALNLENLQRRRKAHIELKVDKIKRSFALFIDGKFVKQWTDDAPFEGRGTSIGFVPQGNPLRIQNIVVSQWDGRLDLETSSAKTAAEDFVRLANGDKLSGRLGKIANGQAALTTSYATMQIPLERVAEISFASQKNAKPRRQAGDVHAFFADGNRLTLALEKFSPQELLGTSESFGKLSAQGSAFERLQFNIYEPNPEGDEDEQWGAEPANHPRGMIRHR